MCSLENIILESPVSPWESAVPSAPQLKQRLLPRREHFQLPCPLVSAPHPGASAPSLHLQQHGTVLQGCLGAPRVPGGLGRSDGAGLLPSAGGV